MRTLTVPAAAAGLRLDVFLARHVPGGSRRQARRVVAEGAVRVNGRPAAKRHRVRPGDCVEVPDAFAAPAALRPNPLLEVPVRYADAAVLVLDKPAGMPSHALRSAETETVANFLLARFPETAAAGGGPLAPGIVHRLDTDTSGLLLAARTPDAYAALRRQFAMRQVRKWYAAVVEGTVAAAGVIRAPLAPAPHNRRKLRVAGATVPGARPADTRYRPLAEGNGRTLLAVRIRTGVRHQIRVHLAAIGHPVVGDALYGAAPVPGLGRHLLHACRLRFVHPVSGAATEVRSPVPDVFAAALARTPADLPPG